MMADSEEMLNETPKRAEQVQVQSEPSHTEMGVQTETSKARSAEDNLYAVVRNNLKEKDELIERLRQEVKNLRDKNLDLQGELDLKVKEIARLQEKIGHLEQANKEFRSQVKELESSTDRLQREKDALEGEIQNMKTLMIKYKKEKEDLEATIEKQQAKVNELEGKIGCLEETIDEHKKAEEDHRNEMKVLKDTIREERQELAERNASLEERVKAMEQQLNPSGSSEKDKELIYLGAMCHQVQKYMFLYFFPHLYKRDVSYTIKSIKMEFENDSTEAAEVQQKWEKLRKEVIWMPSLKSTIYNLTVARNNVAHPDITECDIRKIVDDMKERGESEGSMSAENVENLMKFWLRLKDNLAKKGQTL